MEYDCRIFLKYFVFRMESFQVFQIKKLVILSKSPVFQIKNFEILGFLYIEFEILGISSEMSIISKT